MSDPLQWPQVLEAEVNALRGGPVLGSDAPTDPDQRLPLLHKAIHAHPTSALCLSGGGVRSGTFALGVLQGLAHLGVLGKFDYLSTVSGGGYIGGWLTAWLHRQGPEGREQTLRALDPDQTVAATGQIDAGPVGYLRRMCQYLAPTGGADMWTLFATLGRNLILNWTVILPLIAAALLVPRLFYTITLAYEVPSKELVGLACLKDASAPPIFLAMALVGFTIAVGYVAAVFAGPGRRWSQGRFLAWFLAPLCFGAVGCALFWAAFPCDLNPSWMIGVSVGVPAAGWAIVGLVARRFTDPLRSTQSARPAMGLRTVLAAAVSGPILGGGAYWIATNKFGFDLDEKTLFMYGAFSVPIVLALVLLTITAFVGLASQDMDDEALEWWSRCAAWVGIAMGAWLVASALTLYMADGLEHALGLLERFLHIGRRTWTAIVAALLPLLASLAGLAARSAGVKSPTDKPSVTRRAVQGLSLPFVIVALLTSLAWSNLRATESLEYHLDAAGRLCAPNAVAPRTQPTQPGQLTAVNPKPDGNCHPYGAGFGEVMLLGVIYVAFGLLMSYFVPANRFSLHGMYRERLVRTFIGASRSERSPNPFTGFDGQDDLRVHDLADVRPLHVMNATLNAVSSTKVGRHERTAESFTFTPLHVGNRETGYRPAAEYGSDGGALGTGLSLGMALAVSGAAASPAMGIYSSKSRAFLLTLANARLGLWFGNPSNDTSWRNSEPPLGVGPIVREMLGLTTDRNPYVYLSDGGHYENFGLWEMVARRCRFIVVSDAGCDPEYGFDDLSNAVRRIRLDLGIPIHFDQLDITKAGQGNGNRHGAIGTIRYSVIDGPGAPDGTIFYLKATLSGDETVDIENFARTNTEFPHDSTGDQFFDEARFESYRALGFHTVLSAAGGGKPDQNVESLIEAARVNLSHRS